MSRTDAVRRRRDGSTSRAPHAGPADAGSGKVDGCGRGADEPRRKGRRAAFFDVDGTITKSNVVVPFFMYRLQKLPRWMRAPYTLLFLVRAVMYMVIDWMSRSAFNRIFYACYRGQDVHDTGAFLSSHVWRDYMLPNVFPEALSELRRLKGLGFAIVLVTGSLDLVVRPLAEYIGAEFVISASLEDELGGPREPRDSSRRRFTGRLADEPLAGDAKARRIHELSDEHGLDLARSVAYGDSKADVAMLKCVGTSHAVRPDVTLGRIAREEGWEVHEWKNSSSAVSVADIFRSGLQHA